MKILMSIVALVAMLALSGCPGKEPPKDTTPAAAAPIDGASVPVK